MATLSTPMDNVRRSFDRQAVLAHVDHDRGLLRELAEIFFEDAPDTLERLREAIEHGDFEQLWQAAHALKGAVANFAAERARVLALELERCGRTRDLTDASDLLHELETELQVLFRDLRSFVSD